MNKAKFIRAASGSAAVVAAFASQASAQAVDGFYAGAAIASNTGDFDPGFGDYSYTGSSLGILGGYNKVVGDWVIGGELAYQSDADSDVEFSSYGVKDVLDLKARFGKNFGRTLVYGALGYSQAKGEWDGEHYGDMDGVSYGIGAEMSFGTNAFVGAEILHRDFKSDSSLASYIDDSPLTTASIRFGMRF